jgi:hypothetical protein
MTFCTAGSLGNPPRVICLASLAIACVLLGLRVMVSTGWMVIAAIPWAGFVISEIER